MAAEYQRQYQLALARAQSFGIAGRTEAKVGAALAAMQPWGWHLLADRRWTPTSSANIDLIQVGPGGVLVIDVKSWAQPAIVDGRLYRGQADAEGDVDNLRRISELVIDATSEVGLAPSEVIPVMVFVNQRAMDAELGRIKVLDEQSLVPWAVRRGDRLTEDQVRDLAQLLDRRFPPCDARPAAVTRPPVIAEPVLPIAGRHAEPETLFDARELEAAVLQQAMLAPIESWMTFLHPEQIRLIRRVSSGPSRIRGAAGTGKTVVALHRAAYLAEASRNPVLVTSFIKTLPPALAGLYSTLSPRTSDRVEFTPLHRWANQLLIARGHRSRIDTRVARQAYLRAWSRHGRASGLADLGVDEKYWHDEISHVIKGRGLTEFDEYAALRRIGRRTRLSVSQREIVWAMYVEYESHLRAAGVIDFDDQISLALAEVRQRPLEREYGAVIVDEVQDLSCQALRLLSRISGDGERLLVVGDGQQQIYPGGYTLAEAGISVAGRSAVLRTNYRNAANILAASAQLVIDDDYNDLDDEYEHGRRDVVAARENGQVWTVHFTSAGELRTSAVTHIRNLLAAGHAIAGIAVLCASNDAVKTYLGLLTAANIAAMELADYEGRPVDAVKVGTYQRAKGLEFKDVVLPVQLRAPTARSEDGRQEARELQNRALFVAMTRARDTLWVGRLAAAKS